MLREPSFPAAELDQLKRAARDAASKRRAPIRRTIATRALRRHGNPYPAGDPRYAPTVEESIAGNNAVTLDDVKRFHAQFYGASNAELAIVGDFDADADARARHRSSSATGRARRRIRACPIRSSPISRRRCA